MATQEKKQETKQNSNITESSKPSTRIDDRVRISLNLGQLRAARKSKS